METEARATMMTGLLGEVAQGLGPDAALRLADAYGGRRIYIPTPRRLAKRRKFVEALGTELAMWLARRCGGDRLHIPMGAAPRRVARNRAILRAYDLGMSISEIAEGHGLTDRSVERILAREAL